MRSLTTIHLVCVLGLLPVGCVKYTASTVPVRKATPAGKNFEAVWAASRDVLRKHYFNLDWQDRRAGIITTEPMTGKHFFEFWREDSVTESDIAESSIQTIYRFVQVKIEPTSEGADTYVPTVKVYAFRSDRETPQVTNTSEAYDLFLLPGEDDRPAGTFLLEKAGPEIRTEEHLREGKPSLATGLPNWLVPVGKDGRDSHLEQQLTVEIKVQAARRGARFR